MIARFLVDEGDDPLEVQEMSYPTLVRSAHERGVLRASWTMWSTFREARNSMAHVYSEPVAEKIMSRVPAFLEEVDGLYRNLEGRSREHGKGKR